MESLLAFAHVAAAAAVVALVIFVVWSIYCYFSGNAIHAPIVAKAVRRIAIMGCVTACAAAAFAAAPAVTTSVLMTVGVSMLMASVLRAVIERPTPATALSCVLTILIVYVLGVLISPVQVMTCIAMFGLVETLELALAKYTDIDINLFELMELHGRWLTSKKAVVTSRDYGCTITSIGGVALQ